MSFLLIPRMSEPVLIMIESPSIVRVDLIQASAPVFFPNGRVIIRKETGEKASLSGSNSYHFGENIRAEKNDHVVLFVNNFSNVYANSKNQDVIAYTYSSIKPDWVMSFIRENQILFDFRGGKNETYQLLTTITPHK